MGAWIETLKRADQQRDEQMRTQAKIRLHNAQIINANAPTFWHATIECIRADCATLEKEFPTNKKRQCTIGHASEFNFSLYSGVSLSRRELEVQFSADGQCINVLQAERVDMHAPAITRARRQITISVDDQEQLEFHYEGIIYKTPDTLAEAFIRKVIDD